MPYSIVYADPPWNYTSFSNKIPSRAKAGQTYNAMRMIDIYDFEMPELADDCVLFMWATAPLMPEALHTMKSWGFEFKTIAFTWVKKNKKIVEKLTMMAMSSAFSGHGATQRP